MPQDFDIRKPRPDDLNFIHATFLKSVHKESKLGKSVTTTKFFLEFAKVIDYILDRSEIIIACDQEDPNVIFSYLIYEPGIVHYIFTKLAFRRLYIARDLILHAFPEAQSFQYSIKTLSSERATKNYPNLTYNPFLLMKQGVQ